MSEVKRYSLALHKVKGKFESPEFERDNGEWVKFDDYARLKAEVERLYRNGDLMLKFAAANMTYPAYATMAKDWIATKESKPSV